MDTGKLRKFCPVCKLDNDVNATICEHCRTPFTSGNINTTDPEAPTTRKVDKTFELTQELKEQITRVYPPPTEGVLLFLLNVGEPIGLVVEKEFVLGRGEVLGTEYLFNLAEFQAYSLGVSRRHALIRAVEDKYVLTDLNSSNGTWLNGERLLPNKPHDLPRDSVVQLGRLQLVVVYSSPPGSKKV